MVGLLLILAAVCFLISASRRFGKVPWLEIGWILITVALLIALTGGVVDLD